MPGGTADTFGEWFSHVAITPIAKVKKRPKPPDRSAAGNVNWTNTDKRADILAIKLKAIVDRTNLR